MFNRLTSDQVTSVHHVYMLLRRLRVIGTIETVTKRIQLSEDGGPVRYQLTLVSYDPSTKGCLTPYEKAEAYFEASMALERHIQDLASSQRAKK